MTVCRSRPGLVSTVFAAAGYRHVREVYREAQIRGERVDDRGSRLRLDLPGRATADAVEVAMNLLRKNVVLLAAVRPVAVPDKTEGLQDIESSIHG